MEQEKEFDILNVNELLTEGKKLLNSSDYELLDIILFQLARKYFDSKKIISCDLLRHITTQLILGGYTNIKEEDIKISFHIQNDKYISLEIKLDNKTREDYMITKMYDIEKCHFRGKYFRIGNLKYYTLKELYEKQF